MITLKTLADASLQAVFNQAATHLLTQMERSENTSGCQYRYDGKCCAVGIFIADDEYKPTMEGRNVFGILKRLGPGVVLDADVYGSTQASLLTKFQVIHDTEEPEDWYNSINLLAFKEHLEMVVMP